MFADILKSLEYKEYPSYEELLQKIIVPYGANKGVYNFDKVPFYKEILAQLNKPNIELIALMIAAQSGKTQFLIIIALLWAIRNSTPVYFAVPTKGVADDHFLNKLMPIVNASPFLSDLLIKDVTTGKVSRKTQKALSVRFVGGGSVHMVFAGSRTFLQSYSTSLLILDEYDKIDVSRRKGSSDLLTNALARTSSFASKNKKVLIASTPTYSHKGIDAIRDISTKYIYKYVCPHCGTIHEPDFYNAYFDGHKKDNLTEIELGSQLREITTDSQFCLLCPDCKGKIYEWQKVDISNKGFWEEIPNSEGRNDFITYHVNGLFGFRQWKQIYQNWIGACIEYKGNKGNTSYRAFNNEVLGIPYEIRLSPMLKLADLKLGNYLPKDNRDCHSIATGIDVQTEQKLIYVSVVGFIGAGSYALIDWYSRGYDNEQQLREIIRSIHSAKYGELTNKYTMVDTGGSIGTVVMDICKSVSLHYCIGVKGYARVRDWAYRGVSTAENYKPLLIHPHSTNQRLDELLDSGLVFPANFDDMVYFTHLKNEIPIFEKAGIVYKKINDHAPNDYRDSLRYALFGGIFHGLEIKKAKVSFGWN
jgi:phage terminase large subunit GpA-like protein